MSASPSLLRVTSLGAVSPTLPWSEEAPGCLENETLSEAVPVSRLAALPKVWLSPSERLPLQTNGRSHFPLESPPGSVSISTTHRTQAFSSTFPRAWVIQDGLAQGWLWKGWVWVGCGEKAAAKQSRAQFSTVSPFVRGQLCFSFFLVI